MEMSLLKVKCQISMKRLSFFICFFVCHIDHLKRETFVKQRKFNQLTADKLFIFNDDYFYHKHVYVHN